MSHILFDAVTLFAHRAASIKHSASLRGEFHLRPKTLKAITRLGVASGRELIFTCCMKEPGRLGPLSIVLGASLLANAASPNIVSRFANPPADSRILKIVHGWPDKSEEQDQLIARLGRQGFGGVVCNVSFNQYLESETHWQSFIRAVTEARKAGMALWLYDERGYPSGNAGGLVLRDNPEWEARGLLAAQKETEAGPVEMTVPPGKPFLIAAFPMRDGRADVTAKTDLSAQVEDGQLRWQAPPGRWLIVTVTEDRLYEGTHADGNLWQKMPYVNLLVPEATARFIEVTHQRYADRLGADLGRHFMATFTDEPSLMSCFLKPMPYRPLPWAPNLPVEFNKRRGYALTPAVVLSLLTDNGPQTARHRHNYWLTVGELVSEGFFGQIQTWSRRHNVPSGGHLLMEESLVAHVPLYGDFFRCARRLDAPSIDCLTSIPSEVPWFIARLLSSAAELEGRSLVMSETSDHSQRYRPPGDQRPKQTVTEDQIQGACNRQIVSGVNCITSYYSFADLADDQLRRLNEYVGRCCTMLRGGSQIADIALLYPVESIWTKFTPARHWANEAPAASRIESIWRAAAESLFTAQRDFTVVDNRALAEARVEGDALVHGQLRWRVAVLPGADTLSLAAWENLARFTKSGGVVIALGALPANSETEFPSKRVEDIAREVFGHSVAGPHVEANAKGGAGIYLPRGSEGLLPLVLRWVLEPDVRVEALRSPVRVTHRRLDGSHTYFLINDSPQPWSGEVSFASEGVGELFDAASGQVKAGLDAARATLRLQAHGAVIARFQKARAPRRLPVKPGPLPNFTLRGLPAIDPAPQRGEIVRAIVKPDSARSADGAPAWELEGTITKSNVDTFLFAGFHHAQLLDLDSADCLIADSWVPENQTTRTQLLVILAEDGGEDFIAETGRSLATSGHERSFVPLSRFQRAGWSKPGDGALDARRIREVRVGWGGYLGTEGETVRLSVALRAAVGPQ